KSGKDQPADAPQIGGELRADVLAEDSKGRTAIDDHQDVVARLIDPMNRPDRHAALGQPCRDSNSGSQHQPGYSFTAASVFARGHGEKRTGTAVRQETANEIGTTRRGRIRRGLLHVAAARIGMNKRQHRLHAFDPGRVPTGEIGAGIGRRGEYAEILRPQRRCHDHGSGLVEGLGRPRTNPEPYAADPGTNCRVFGKRADELRQGRGRRLGYIKYAHGCAVDGGEAGNALRGEARWFTGGGSGSELRAHDGPPTRRATTGVIRSTSTAIPRSFG